MPRMVASPGMSSGLWSITQHRLPLQTGQLWTWNKHEKQHKNFPHPVAQDASTSKRLSNSSFLPQCSVSPESYTTGLLHRCHFVCYLELKNNLDATLPVQVKVKSQCHCHPLLHCRTVIFPYGVPNVGLTVSKVSSRVKIKTVTINGLKWTKIRTTNLQPKLASMKLKFLTCIFSV